MAAVKPESLLEYIVIEYRWLLVITVLMPLSFLWKIWSKFRNYVVFTLNSAPRAHGKKVKEVQRQVYFLRLSRPEFIILTFSGLSCRGPEELVDPDVSTTTDGSTSPTITSLQPPKMTITSIVETSGSTSSSGPRQLSPENVKAWLKGDRKTKLCTARPTWQTMSFRHAIYKKSFTNINVNLVDILEVDTQNMTVRCEPLVSMGQLSRTLEPLGLALAVVPELDQLTVGGLVMGTGVETSSHIYGLFQHICLQYELVLADGSIVTCSKDENPDLFYSIPWSYGTLGFLTSAVIKVVPAKKYARIEYHPYTNLRDLAKKFQEESLKKHPHQFVEALLYTKDSGVVMTGDMVNAMDDDEKLNPIGKWHSEWFFKQVEKYLKKYRKGNRNTHVEYIPLRDYYHRHSRSLFWELQDIVSFGNNILFRYLFGWLMPPEVSLLKLTQPDAVARLYEKAHVIQDMLVPIETLEEAVEVFHEEFEVYPIWLCPFKVFTSPGQLRTHSGEWQMFVDIGVYGVPKANNFETVSSTRKIEQFVTKQRGFQMLYADTYTTRDEFRQMFDHTLYDKLRNSLPHCMEAFPEIYGKVNRNVRQ